MFNLIKTDNNARLGEMHTVHGMVKTPAFMNVGTTGAIRGAVSSYDLENLKCQIELCNTYHLHIRPGDEVVKDFGGLHKFIGWDKPILTDSGGFQVFSLASLRKVTQEGVHFSSHIDGEKIFMGPKESMRIQSNLAATIAMAFDECVANPAEYDYVKASCERTLKWLHTCKEEIERLNALHDTINKNQILFGINQGGIYQDLRIQNMIDIAKLDLEGYAIGGLAVGEEASEMYKIIDTVMPYMPENKPRYLMGVGKPSNIIQSIARGIDLFDCVMPSRNARHGNLFTWQGTRNILNAKYMRDDAPIDPQCKCPVCKKHSRGYIRHLLKVGEMLGMRLAVMHNLYFYNDLMEKIRENIVNNTFEDFKNEYIEKLDIRC